jgi:N-acetylmuramic acid 6-phosphate etherase
VVSNLMVDMNPSNVKLRERAVRMVQTLTGSDSTAAQQALERSGWVVKKAISLKYDPRPPGREGNRVYSKVGP